MSRRPSRVQLFPTCLVNEFHPSVGIAAAEVLERLGVRVEVPEDAICCGQPAYNGGFEAEARQVLHSLIRVLERSPAPVVVPSGSCADMLIHQGPQLFRGEPDMRHRASQLARRTYEFTQFLREVLDVQWQGRLAPGRKVAYHPSCHLSRGLGVKDAPLELLRDIRGVRLLQLDPEDECCGFGGLFAVKNPDISGAMLEKKCRAVEVTDADTLVSCDLGCLLHVGGGLRRQGRPVRIQHVAEILAASRPDSPAADAGAEG